MELERLHWRALFRCDAVSSTEGANHRRMVDPYGGDRDSVSEEISLVGILDAVLHLAAGTLEVDQPSARTVVSKAGLGKGNRWSAQRRLGRPKCGGRRLKKGSQTILISINHCNCS